MAGLIAPFRWSGHQIEVTGPLLFVPVLITAAVWLAQVLFAPRAPHRGLVALSDTGAAQATAISFGLGLVVALELLAESSLEIGQLGPEAGALVALVILLGAAALLWAFGGVLAQG